MQLKIKNYPILKLINNPIELRQLSKKKLNDLCLELRKFLIYSISQSGGHFASNLGTVELTVALHYVYNTPFDKIVWDTGHQSYPHKIITERRKKILSIRQYKGLHPFPFIKENKYDVFSVGHAATSISAGLGIAIAEKYKKLGRKIACIIGDGAITSGMAFEAMNHVGYVRANLLVILNDNKMSISNNVGALKNNLLKFYKNTNYKTEKLKNKENAIVTQYSNNLTLKEDYSDFLFRALGFKYIGPIDGHNILNLIKIIKKIRLKKGPYLLHILTKKGYGYLPAEKDPIKWHAVPKFNLKLGKLEKKNDNYPSYSTVFGDWLCDVAKRDKKLMAITPAMCEGSGMLKFSKKYPDQYFDVAIAEQHAVTFAAGLAVGGYRPIVSIYSTFLQRAYDQVIHDVAIQNLPVLFAIDRGGIVGQDGQTHQGSFDLSYLRCIPNMIIMTPSNENECRLMLHTGYSYRKGPIAVRYPRDNGIGVKFSKLNKIPIGKGIVIRYGEKIAILNFGTLLNKLIHVAKILNTTLVDMRFVKPLDKKLINNLISQHLALVTVEENTIIGGAGSGVNEYIMKKKFRIPVLNIGLPDNFILQGNKEEILKMLELDVNGIYKKIKNWF